MNNITLPVSQEARIAAIDYFFAIRPNDENTAQLADGIRGGQHDNLAEVQAFAKFETQIRNAILEEAAGVAENYCATHQSWSTPAGSLGDYIAASIRQLRERGA